MTFPRPMSFYPEHEAVQQPSPVAERLRALNSAAALLDTRGAYAFTNRTKSEHPRGPHDAPRRPLRPRLVD